MQRVRVKIEGLRNPREAVHVAQMGADAIGMVFAESPRWVSPEQAAGICAALPPWVATVGVFVNAEADTINGIVERTGLTCVQLHGDEGPEEIERIAAPCIKAFRVKDESSLVHARQWVQALPSRRNFAGVLLDAYSRQVRGGSGEQFNWSLVADARAAGLLGELEPFILAGGLTPENVNLAIEVVKPWAVDVASGVEKAPGVKDLKKVSRLIRNTLDGDQIKSDFWI